MNSLRFCSCLLAMLTVYGAELSWSQATVAPAPPSVSQTQSLAKVPVKLPIRLYLDHLVLVEGCVGSIDKLSLLVDTGASPSVIDQKIARRLDLTEQPGRVNLWSKSFQTGRVILPLLRLGPVQVESLPVLTEDLSFLQKAIGRKVDGIVGLDVLRKSSFTINYRTKEMMFGRVDSLTFSAPFDTDTPVVTIRTTIQNQNLRLVVDTGGPDLMLFQSRMTDSTHFQELGTETVADVGGTFPRRRVRIPDVYLGKEPIGAQTAFVVDDRKDEGDDFDGVLGVKGHQFWKIAFDFEHRRFSWELLAPALYDDVQHSSQMLAEANSGTAITVLVFNFRQAPAETLVKAEKEAGRILEQAGVPVTWRDCSTGNEPCRKGPGRVFFLAMQAGPIQNKLLDTISGFSVPPAHLAAVYFDYLPRLPGGESNKNDTALILGCVIAHELGHLLLGARGHSTAGIMQAHWGIEQTQLALMSQLSFLPGEARLMHADTVAPEAKNDSSSALTSH